VRQLRVVAGRAVPVQNFRIVLQRVLFTANEIQMSWSGTGSTFRLWAGTTSGGSDVLNVEVTGTSYTWEAPRTEALYYLRVFGVQGTSLSAPSNDQLAFTIDLRNVIDALFFRSGPMSDSAGSAALDTLAGVWPDGTRLAVLVSNDATTTSQANADIFVNDYASLLNGSVTATTSMTSDSFGDTWIVPGPGIRTILPDFDIGIRVLSGFCGAVNVIACTPYGPFPLGVNKSIVTMNTSAGAISVAHELGHADGLGHVHVNSSARPELNFLMNPALVSTQMTEPEKNAIAAAFAGGLKPGMRRSQALATGLVLPWAGQAATPGRLSISSGPRGPVRCRIVDSGR